MLEVIDQTHGDYHHNRRYLETTLHPFETVFIKNNRLSSRYIDILEKIYRHNYYTQYKQKVMSAVARRVD